MQLTAEQRLQVHTACTEALDRLRALAVRLSDAGAYGLPEDLYGGDHPRVIAQLKAALELLGFPLDEAAVSPVFCDDMVFHSGVVVASVHGSEAAIERLTGWIREQLAVRIDWHRAATTGGFIGLVKVLGTPEEVASTRSLLRALLRSNIAQTGDAIMTVRD